MDEIWDDLSSWWIDAVRDDPRDSDDLFAVLDELLAGSGGFTIDLGCGEGQVMRHLGGAIVGTDAAASLLDVAVATGPTVQASLPDLSWVRPQSFDRAVCVSVLDLIEDHRALFDNTAVIVRPGGHLLVVMNHPAATSPRSEPLVDPDGEVLWRWGSYLDVGRFEQRLDGREVTLHHRPLGDVLTTASESGWILDRLIERGPSDAALARFPQYRGQEHIPTVLGARWRLPHSPRSDSDVCGAGVSPATTDVSTQADGTPVGRSVPTIETRSP